MIYKPFLFKDYEKVLRKGQRKSQKKPPNILQTSPSYCRPSQLTAGGHFIRCSVVVGQAQ